MPKFIFIPHDLTGRPGALIDSASGVILAEYNTIIEPKLCSDTGATNSEGLIALFSPFGAFVTTLQPRIFQWDGNITFTSIATFGLSFPGLTHIRAVGSNFWIFGQSPLNTPANIQPSFFKFDNNGALLNTIGPLSLGVNHFVRGFCINDTESVAYYAESQSIYNSPIRTWNLLTNSAGPLITAGVGANTFVSEMFAVPGSTDLIVLLSFYDGLGGNNRVIRRYTAAGAIVYSVIFSNIIDMGDDTLEAGLDPDLNSCWARWPDAPNYSTTKGSAYTHLSFNDGSKISEISVPVNVNNAPCTTCPLLVLGTTPPPPPPNPGSGIYRIIPNKRQDTIYNDDLTSTFDTKIP